MTGDQRTFRTAFAELAKTFARPVDFDEDGSCLLDVDGQASVVLQDMPGRAGVFVWAVVTGLPEDGDAAARARYLLELQDCWRETEGFWFALDPDSRRLVLQGLVGYDELATAEAIAERLESFLEVLERTRRELASRWPSDADADTEWEAE